MDISEINVRLSAIKQEIERHERQIESLEYEYEELDQAKGAILQYIGSDSEEHDDVSRQPPTEITKKQVVVWDAVPLGKEKALKPSQIAEHCPRLKADYVRTTLRRLVELGLVKSDAGDYWTDL
ncbi:MAG: hypothetical protein AAGJ50_15325 [Pseudomonadota bacterium]